MTTYAPTGFTPRPAFDFAIEWGTTPFVEDTQELGIIQVGKGAPAYQRLRRYTGSVYEFSLGLESEQAINEFEAFCFACRGRLNGFWIPYPNATITLKSAATVDGVTQITIARQGLLESWNDEASHYLTFYKPGEALRFAKVASVTLGNAAEIVTLDTTVTGLDDTWDAYRLIYARFADDKFELEYDSNTSANITLRVVELTMEYAAVETGQQPVYLYEFEWRTDAQVFARFASFDTNIVHDGHTFTSGAFEHDGLRQSIDRGDSDTTITSVYQPGNPMIRFFPFSQTSPLTVRIWERNIPDAEGVATLLFTGLVMEPKFEGAQITAKCKSLLAALGGKFPRFYVQSRCNYNLFGPCCKLDRSDYVGSGLVSRAGINNLEVSGFAFDAYQMSDNYFSFGWAEYGEGSTFQVRTITRSMIVKHYSVVPSIVLEWTAATGKWKNAHTDTILGTVEGTLTDAGMVPTDQDITILSPATTDTPKNLTVEDGQFDGQQIKIVWGGTMPNVLWPLTGENIEIGSLTTIGSLVQATVTHRALITMNYPIVGAAYGHAIRLYPGCDLTASTCRSKFGNFNNFGGHPPALDNLSVRAVDPVLAQGVNKK